MEARELIIFGRIFFFGIKICTSLLPYYPQAASHCYPLLTAVYRCLLADAPFTALAIEMVNIQWLLTECDGEELRGVNTVGKSIKYILSFWSLVFIILCYFLFRGTVFLWWEKFLSFLFFLSFFKSKGKEIGPRSHETSISIWYNESNNWSGRFNRHFPFVWFGIFSRCHLRHGINSKSYTNLGLTRQSGLNEMNCGLLGELHEQNVSQA